jgi:sensor c-di-GMP phosphodiesterase-like protein
MNLAHTLSDVFVIRPVVIRGGMTQTLESVEAEVQPGTAQGVFVDPKSLASFPIAAAVVTTISQIVVRVMKAEMIWVALIVSLLIGALIVAITMTDPNARPKSKLEWAISLAIAVINCLLLYAAVIGIDQLAGVQQPPRG